LQKGCPYGNENVGRRILLFQKIMMDQRTNADVADVRNNVKDFFVADEVVYDDIRRT